MDTDTSTETGIRVFLKLWVMLWTLLSNGNSFTRNTRVYFSFENGGHDFFTCLLRSVSIVSVGHSGHSHFTAFLCLCLLCPSDTVDSPPLLLLCARVPPCPKLFVSVSVRVLSLRLSNPLGKL